MSDIVDDVMRAIRHASAYGATRMAVTDMVGELQTPSIGFVMRNKAGAIYLISPSGWDRLRAALTDNVLMSDRLVAPPLPVGVLASFAGLHVVDLRKDSAAADEVRAFIGSIGEEFLRSGATARP